METAPATATATTIAAVPTSGPAATTVKKVDKKVNWVFIALTDCGPLVMAKDLGYFQQRGLDVSLEKQMVANMKANNMDGYCVGEPWHAQAVYDKVGFTHLATQDPRRRRSGPSAGLARLPDPYFAPAHAGHS